MTAGFFLEMGWKSALIAGAVLVLAMALRSRSAADRAIVLRIGIVMLLALPVIALALPALQIEAWAAPEMPARIAAAAATEAPMAMPTLGAGLEASEPTIWDDPTPLILLAYLGGLLMAGSRLLAGLWTLRGWTRAAREVTDREWLQAFDRVRWAAPDGERLRLLVSDDVPSPLSWGWRNPVILIDPDTLDLPEDAAAILAHEVAHVARRDWPALMLSRLAAALFWFNPLVWMLEREVVQQAEEAADCEAVDRIEPARYAETLLSWAQCNRRGLPANSIAPSESALGRRVRTILDGRLRERPSGSAWTALAALMCIGIATPVAALELVEAAAPLPPRAPLAPLPAIPAAAPAAPAAASAAPPAPAALPLVSTITVTAHPHPADAVPPVPPTPRAAPVPSTPRAAPVPPVPHAAPHPPRTPRAKARVQVEVPSAEIERAVREAQRVRVRAPELAMRDVARARREVQVSMAHGAEGMLRGAEGMERGAQNMLEESRRLRDRDYRERQIARARARGETVTHEDLLEAADGLEEGAEGMREGARGMREGARRMRDGRD